MTSEHIIDIEKLVHGGYGLGRLPDGMVAMVPMVVPGETVRIKAGQRKKSYLIAELKEIITAVPERTTPSCPHYGSCGGCDLQHIVYKEQLRLKEKILKETLDRAKVMTGQPEDLWAPTVPSPHRYGYRQRIRLQVDDHGRPGFFQSRSDKIIPIESCAIARDELNRVLMQVRRNPAIQDLLAQTKELELLLSPDDGEVVVFIHYLRKPRPTDRKQAQAAAATLNGVMALYLAADNHEVLGPFTKTASGKTPDKKTLHFSFPEEICGQKLTMSFEPGGFCQINQEQNNNMLQLLLAWSGQEQSGRVLDLYCGLGNFSIPLAAAARQVAGMDLQRSAIRSAIKNAAAAGLTNCEFNQNTAISGARQLTRDKEKFDLILLDPPRQGCLEVIPFLTDLGAKRLLYVSCNPTTLARDLAEMGKKGFRLKKIALIDMFPQTHHIECLALLEKKADSH